MPGPLAVVRSGPATEAATEAVPDTVTDRVGLDGLLATAVRRAVAASSFQLRLMGVCRLALDLGWLPVGSTSLIALTTNVHGAG